MAGAPASEAPRFDLARAWREPPAIATDAIRRYSGTVIFVLGGILVAISTPLMPVSAAVRMGLIGSGVFAVAAGAVCYLFGHRLPRWGFEVLLVGTVLGITAITAAVPATVNARSLTVCLLLPMLAAATLLSLRAATGLVMLAVVLRTVLLARGGSAAGDILMIQAGTLSMMGMVGWLTRLADAVEQDPLTGLLNRRGVDRRLEEQLARLEREGGQFAVVALDIDDFKGVNAVGGHAHGDRVMLECVAAWRHGLPTGALLGRYGSDEFVLLLPDTSLGRASDIADRLRGATAGVVTASAGVAAWQYGDSRSMLLNRSDVALYEAKAAGRDCTVVYGDPAREASELESAIGNGELQVMLQPIVTLPTGELMGFEALIRWERPGRGTVAPLDFVPHAEHTGAIHSLGSWVLSECCRLAMTLPGPRHWIGVNVSVHELRRAEYSLAVRHVLERWQMPGELLVVEVTESVFEDDDPQVIRNLEDLRALGARVAIDDFGAGYSSLRRIELLPIDVIKVDGALVSSIRPGHDPAILRAVVTMGRSLGVQLLAEHVESQAQADVLCALGYDLAQGFLFGRPDAPDLARVAALS